MPGSRVSTSRRLLCEGWIEPGCEPSGENAVLYPERAYVVQPGQPNTNSTSRVWFAKGKPTNIGEAHLNESAGANAQLVESYDQLELEERKLSDGSVVKLPKGGRWFVEGPFQRSDVRNANKRVYPRGIWEKLVADQKSYVQETVRARGMLGHLEHPSDGRTDGAKGALVVTDLKLKEDGVVWGACELLDTPHGLILQEYTRKNVRWGVSSRGNGAVKDDGTVDESSFVLETWDAVMKPSVPGAYPTLVTSKTSEGAKPTPTTGTSNPNPATARVVVAETAEATAFVAEAKALSETAIDGLSTAERAKLTSDLIQAMNRGGTLVSQQALPAERAVELQGWLTRKLQGLSESGPLSLDEAIDAALSDAEGDCAKDGEGYTRVIESLRQRLSDSVEETADLRERLEAAESRSSALQGQCDELTEQLSAVEGRLADETAKLKLAEDLLATRPQAQANGLVTAAVDEAIRQVPALGQFRDVLSNARNADGVTELAERLLPRVTVGRREAAPATQAPAAAVASRSSLPVGIVESDDAGAVAPSRPDSRTLSEGVRLVTAVVASKG